MIAGIKHTDITNSHAKARGGAIYIEKTNVGNIVDLTVSDCNIESNSSDAYGGALVLNSFGNSRFHMDNCTIKIIVLYQVLGACIFIKTVMQVVPKLTIQYLMAILPRYQAAPCK